MRDGRPAGAAREPPPDGRIGRCAPRRGPHHPSASSGWTRNLAFSENIRRLTRLFIFFHRQRCVLIWQFRFIVFCKLFICGIAILIRIFIEFDFHLFVYIIFIFCTSEITFDFSKKFRPTQNSNPGIQILRKTLHLKWKKTLEATSDDFNPTDNHYPFVRKKSHPERLFYQFENEKASTSRN